MYVAIIKPFLDKITACIVLLITLPVLIIVIGVLYLSNDRSVWFIQPRPGKNCRIFKLIKFRTMTDEKDADGNLLPDEKRLTAVGKLIRKTSLDELPQLINVLKGDMSIVGPRPLLIEYLSIYSSEQQKRHNLKPGITGWAQVNGRNAISWNDKFAYDVWYVEHVSFWLDIKILFLTVKKVIQAEGISSDTSATMEKFSGNN